MCSLRSLREVGVFLSYGFFYGRQSCPSRWLVIWHGLVAFAILVRVVKVVGLDTVYSHYSVLFALFEMIEGILKPFVDFGVGRSLNVVGF